MFLFQMKLLLMNALGIPTYISNPGGYGNKNDSRKFTDVRGTEDKCIEHGSMEQDIRIMTSGSSRKPTEHEPRSYVSGREPR